MKKVKNCFYIGQADSDKKSLYINLDKCYHLLIAGQTGQGKSNLMHQIIQSIDGDLIIIDPKNGAEFNEYNKADFPRLKAVISDYNGINAELDKAHNELNKRLGEFSKYRTVKKIQEYNEIKGVEPMPHLIIIIDEYQEILNIRGVKTVLFSLLMKGRAAGVHIILATQRPDAHTCTRLKSQCNYRLALKVFTANESRMILGEAGAELLQNKGDFLLKTDGKTEKGHTPLYTPLPYTPESPQKAHKADNKRITALKAGLKAHAENNFKSWIKALERKARK